MKLIPRRELIPQYATLWNKTTGHYYEYYEYEIICNFQLSCFFPVYIFHFIVDNTKLATFLLLL